PSLRGQEGEGVRKETPGQNASAIADRPGERAFGQPVDVKVCFIRHRDPAANYGLVVVLDIPGETQSRRKIVLVLRIRVGRPVKPHVGEQGRFLQVVIPQIGFVEVRKAVLERQPGAYAPGVLAVKAEALSVTSDA